METNPKDLEQLLYDLCTTFGFGMAVRDPDRFVALAQEGPEMLADAVLLAEGLDPVDPTLDPRLRRGVYEFVAARFERWAARSASDHPPDPPSTSDDDR